jgi:hypothetical protein
LCVHYVFEVKLAVAFRPEFLHLLTHLLVDFAFVKIFMEVLGCCLYLFFVRVGRAMMFTDSWEDVSIPVKLLLSHRTFAWHFLADSSSLRSFGR